jgi:hypothetical protein
MPEHSNLRQRHPPAVAQAGSEDSLQSLRKRIEKPAKENPSRKGGCELGGKGKFDGFEDIS